MAIHLHRSNRAEALVERLCWVLQREQAIDPFLPYPVVVGSRGMERWLRHEIATRNEIAAGLAFPFPRQALAGAAHWLVAGATDADARFWEMEPEVRELASKWERDALAFRLVGLLRGHSGDPDFAAVSTYLAEGDGVDGPTPKPANSEGASSPGDGASYGDAGRAVTARELLFAAEVGDVLDRFMHDRPGTALEWASDPDTAGEDHRWLARLLAGIGASEDPHSPAVLHQHLIRVKPRPLKRSMCVFGLSTMGPGDRERLVAIAQSIDLHLFVLVPTNHWFQHQRTRVEANAARSGAKTDAERAALEAELRTDNPILTSLGGPSRDLQFWLEDVGYQGDDVAVPSSSDADEPRMLQRLQRWILAAESVEAVKTAWLHDESVGLHSCYGALRQCEVLRDELLGMFAADPTLEPRDVLVMTPDIETYAPLVTAVLSRKGLANTPDGSAAAALPRIPLAIADLGLSRTNPVAEVLLKVLEVAGDRLSATWIIDFLALEPVRRKWGLADPDLADLREMVRTSGMRWGEDAADREAVGQPALDQNTIRFGIERLALGVLMPNESELRTIPPPPEGVLGPGVPLDVQSRDRVDRVGRLGVVLRTLIAHRRVLSVPASLEEWRDRLATALDELAATNDKTSWLRGEVDAALDDMARLGAPLGPTPVERASVYRWLRDGFEIPQRGDRVITGAVQVCALEPMRSVPFRVVVLLGMDDRAFPRAGQRRTWDPMSDPQPGERDRREVDRHLMLEAILSARERLLVLWSGSDVQQGKEQPAAVPIEEFLDTLGTLTAQTREQLVQEHSLQPWSATNFDSSAASFDQGMAQAAGHLREIASGTRTADPLGLLSAGNWELPVEETVVGPLRIDELATALLQPHKLLLRDRLGLSVSYEQAAIEDREPMELDTLDAWSLRARAVDHLLDETGDLDGESLLEPLHARLCGEGDLPLSAGGESVLSAELKRAVALVENLNAVDGTPGDAIELSLQLDGAPVLIGGCDLVSTRGDELLLQFYTPSKAPNERLKMHAWLSLLATTACGVPVAGARLVGHGSSATLKSAGGEFMVFEGSAEDASATLARLVAIWRQARRRPLPLFKKTSHVIASVLDKAAGDALDASTRSEIVTKVETAWNGGFKSKGDIEDSWVRAFYVDYDPVDHLDDVDELSLIGLARCVWSPIVSGLEAGKRLGPEWRVEEER